MFIQVNKVTKTVLDLALEKQLDTLVALIEKTNAANNVSSINSTSHY